MLLKKFVFVFMFLLIALALPAQNSHLADSLENELSRTQKPQEQYNILIDLSDQLISSDVSKALSYGLQAFALAEEQSNDTWKLNSSLLVARIYYFMSDLNQAMEYAMIAKNLANTLSLEKELAFSLDAIGAIYYDIGYQAKSSENFFTSLKIYEELNDKNGIGGTYCRIGTLYLDQKDYNKAP